ncbi:mannosyltransferase [Flavobacterium sp. ALD4]|uniref:glycosyltransferase family 32 protein n=1 Tax=Flavobacterium sp. ALD4 TaxID=2058314 RepID=UPI000C3427A6|nr:glycosyltransferase [Flavobacterium sp. ALD4]PKH67679.1 mannosyltransferase [Flavobacterium sp. ALD4]
MINKIIHYCWFGGKRKPELVRDCIKSWKKHLPEYKIIEWNEKNADLSHPFVQHAYKMKKWAFVADYVRLTVLYENGGLYLDTDMLVLKPLDSFLINDCFFGAEDNNYINCAIIGAIKNNNLIKKCLLKYDSVEINKEINWFELVIPIIITNIFRSEYGYNNGFDIDIVKINNVVIYPTIYFYPFPFNCKNDIANFKKYIRLESHSVHLWVGSWFPYNEFHYIRTREYSKGLGLVFNNLLLGKLNLKYMRKLASSVKQSFTIKSIDTTFS